MRPEDTGLPRALVLLAARNGQAWIERQIASVLSQRGVAVRLCVRDDGSADATRAIVARLAEADPRVSLFPDHAATGSAAGNFFRLVAEADARDCDIVAFCDQDDEWFIDKLARARAALLRSSAGGYSAAVQARWADGREKRLGQNPRQRPADYLFEGAGQGCTFVLTAALFAQVQAMLLKTPAAAAKIHYHDWAVYALARSLGAGWIMDAEPALTYHQHAANDTGARSSLGGILRRVDKIRDGWYRAQVDAIVAFVRAINPRDEWAARWAELSARRGAAGAVRRVWFLALYGRRRPLDRIIQQLAVLGGCL
jgi:rhamnosyltransferase